jgi:Spy/CpxP family protein refolding chaperone
MMKKLPWVLLAISIIFNFTFAGGFLHARSGYEAAKAPETSTEIVADEFNLTDKQRKIFATLREEAQARAKEMRQSFLLARQDLWSAMSSASPDPQRVQEIQDRLAELYWEYRGQASEHLRQFLAALRPEQREAVMQKIRQRERERFRRGGHHLLKRFDTDGDGKLDETERSRAHKYFRSRRSWGRKPHPYRRSPWHPPGSWPRSKQRGPSTRPAPPPRWRGGPQPWPRRRPDANRDGEFGDGKRSHARQGMDAFRGHPRPPQWMLDRFDTDRDGKLSPKERQAAMRAPWNRKFKNTGPSEPGHTATRPERE